MKKLFIILTAFTLIIFVPQTFADQVVTGNASAETNVQNTNNNGSVESHVVTIVNGVKTETDSTFSGSINVVVTNNADSRPQSSVTPNIQITTAQPTHIIPKPHVTKRQKNFFDDFLSNLKRFFFPFWR